MSNLNSNTIENVSIAEVKELDSFISSYNKNRELPEEERKASVLAECLGTVTEKNYYKLIEKAKTYTADGEVPIKSEWGQVRVIYRDIGNKKIANAKENLERLAEEYTGKQTIEDETHGLLTPKQVEENLLKAEKKVSLIKTLRVVASIVAGAVGFFIVTLLLTLLASALTSVSNVILQLMTGVLAICGLVASAWGVTVLMKAIEQAAKHERDLAEVTEAMHHDKIVALQTSIKTAEEHVKRVETQYGVEILARTDFSNSVKDKKKKDRGSADNKVEAIAEIHAESETVENNTDEQEIEAGETQAESEEKEIEKISETQQNDEKSAEKQKKRAKKDSDNAVTDKN